LISAGWRPVLSRGKPGRWPDRESSPCTCVCRDVKQLPARGEPHGAKATASVPQCSTIACVGPVEAPPPPLVAAAGAVAGATQPICSAIRLLTDWRVRERKNLVVCLVCTSVALALGAVIGAVWHRQWVFPFPQLSEWRDRVGTGQAAKSKIPGRWH
jgi:hypothetical protein